MRVVSIENGSGGLSPGCICSADQSMVRPSRRGGVPVFKRPSTTPIFSKVRESPSAGASPTRPAGICFSPIWMRPRKNVPVVRTTDAQDSSRPSANLTPQTRPSLRSRSSASASMTARLAVSRIAACMACRIKLAVGLGARTAHGRAFAAVQDTELDAAGVGNAAHEAVESVDFPHQMAFAEPANGRIAGHGADGRESVRHQGRFRAHTGAGSRGFTAGMAAADDDDVEFRVFMWTSDGAFYRRGQGRSKKSRFCRMFHVKHRPTGNKIPVDWFICRCRSRGRSRPGCPRRRPGLSGARGRGRRCAAPRPADPRGRRARACPPAAGPPGHPPGRAGGARG